MEAHRGHMTEILDLTLEIIHLLIGEKCALVRMMSIEGLLQGMYPPTIREKRGSPSMDPPPSSVIPEKNNNDKKILEVTQKIIELLTGEVFLEDCPNFQKNITTENPDLSSSDLCEELQACRTIKEDCGSGEEGTVYEEGVCAQTEDDVITIKAEPDSREEEFWDRSRPPSSAQIEHDHRQEVNDCDGRRRGPMASIKEEMDEGDPEPSYTTFCIKEDMFVSRGVEPLDGATHLGVTFPYDWSIGERAGGAPSQIMETKVYNCDGCGKSFSSSCDFLKHRLMYEGPHFLSCAECGKCFSTEEQLAKHQRVHTRPKPYSCSECEKSFPLKQLLVIHQRSHTGEKPYACKDCGKCFSQRSSLGKHLRSHSGEKPYPCPVCGKRFGSRPTLIIHHQSHTDEKPFACSECGRRFHQKIALKKHQRIHTGERPYACTECGKRFTQKHSLSMHKRTHSGEKPFECTECGRRFSRNSLLIVHQRIHSGEKPYSCTECGKSFRHKSVLSNHQQTHTREQSFPCVECGKCFNRSCYLILHQRVHQRARLAKSSVTE